MIFTGQFKSLHRDKLYTVNIDCANGGSHTVNVALGPEPFVTNMDGGSNTIYVPVKYQSATVQIVANNSQSSFLNLYSSTPKQNKVELYTMDGSTNKLVWSGYTSPNIYDTPYDFETETWSVEAIDRLSVLKYYDYKPIGNSKDFVSFTQIINACLVQAGFTSSSHWHFSNATNVYDSSTDKSFLTDQLYISEADFFDEDDEPMKMNEVLEEICKYCGVTCVAYGNDVYFLDYDAIQNGTATYRRYYNHTVGTTSAVTSTSADCSVNATYTITKDSYTSSGTNLSLDNVYSKVTVRDSLYTVDSIIPSLFEDEDLQNVGYVDEDNQMWSKDFTQMTMDPGKKVAKWPLYDWEGAREDDTYFYMKSRYYTNKKYEHRVYDSSGNGPSLFPLIDNSVMDATQRQGILMTKFNIASGKNQSDAVGNMTYDNWTNYLMLTVNHTGSLNSLNKPKLITKDESAKPFFMSGKARIIVKGTLILTDRYMFPAWNYTPGTYDRHDDTSIGYFPNTGTFVGDFDGWTAFWTDFGNVLYVPKTKLTLKMGINVNGTEVIKNVPYYPTDTQESDLREDGGSNPHHEVFYNNFDIQNTVPYDENIPEKGYLFDTGLADTEVVNVKPIIKIYGMDDLLTQFGSKNPLACAFIKDFDVQALVGYQGGKDENGTNTEYSYVIDDQFVQELSPIEFKICSYDNKQLTYSAPAWKDPSTNKFKFVDKLHSRALGQTQRAEHLLCYRIVNQYNTPSKKVSINLFEENVRPWTKFSFAPLTTASVMDSTNFILDTVSFDYGTDTARCELVQKK